MADRTGRVVLFIGTFVFVIACGSERAVLHSLPDPGPTPYTLEIPAWAVDSIHTMYIPSDNPMTVEGIALGRRLFYEKALSRDGTLACSSCHIQEHAFSDPRRVSVGIEGDLGHRNSMALMNLAWGHFFFWDARAMSLELQALEPVNDHREMFNAWSEVLQRLRDLPGYAALFDAAFGTMDIDSVHVSFALAQFERTLLSFDSPFDRSHYGCDSTALTPAEIRGKELFFGGAHCVDCHEPPLFADHDMINIGLDSMPTDKGLGERTGLYKHLGLFKTPTLRNIAASAPYMHDGRFATLEEVVDFYADDVHLNTPNFHDHMFAWKLDVVKLDAQERKDLVTFLHALTDSNFLQDTRFSDPAQ